MESGGGTGRPVLAITGATGFIGQTLLKACFAAGWQPRILIRRYPRNVLVAGQTIDIVQGDLEDTDALRQLVRGADAVVHLAGLIKALEVEDFLRANAGGTERLLQVAATENPRAALVHVSSLAAREPRLSPYADSKRASEARVTALAGPRPWLIVRPAAVYGPGDPATLPMFKAAKAGFLPYPAASGSRVSLIHVADVVGAILAALPPLQAGEMASGLTIELDDGQVGGHDWPAILTALAIAADHPVRSLRLPRPVMVPIAAGNEWLCRLRRQADVLSRAKLSELYHPDWVVTGPKMSEICRWQPGFALMNGFIDTYRWYQEHSFTA